MLEQLCSEASPQLAEHRLQCQLDPAGRADRAVRPGQDGRVFDNLLNNCLPLRYPDTLLQITATRQSGLHPALLLQCRGHHPAGKTLPYVRAVLPAGLCPQQPYRQRRAGAGHCKEIVEAHGGSITAQSQDQQIRFTVTLPAP